MLRRVLLVSVCLAPVAAAAGDWTFSRGVSVRETYTDNLHLSDSDKESEFITEIRPVMALHGKGGRIQADISYGFQYLNYAGDSSNKVYHQLQADSRTELARDHLFLNAGASVGQSLIDSLGRSGDGVANRTGNLETTSTYTINPYYVTRLGSQAQLNVGYTNDGVFHSSSGDDSISNTLSAELTSGTRYYKTPWSVEARTQRINYSDSDSTRYKSVNGRLGYVFDRQWRVDGSLGYDDNTYSTNGDSETRGGRWDARVIWTPNPRTSLTVGTGHRYIGQTPILDFSHTSKRTTWTASYRKDVIDFRTMRLSRDWDQFGRYIASTNDAALTPVGQQRKQELLEQLGTPEGQGEILADPFWGPYVNTFFGQASISANTFISERFQTALAFKGNRSNLGLIAFHETREYEGLATEEEVMGLSLHGSRQLTGLISGNANLSWQQDESQNDPLVAQDRDITTWRLGIGLSRPLSTHLRGSVQYQFSDRASNVAADDYSENRLWLSVSANWK